MIMAGIVGYGVYIPKYRIKLEEIARIWGQSERKPWKGLMVKEKAVAALDEDACTIAVEAARNAIKHAGIDPKEIGAVYVGSESHPYAVKPTASTVAEAIGATPYVFCADLEFACKAGTAGMQMCMAHVGSGMIKYGLAIGADTAQGRPGDALEYTAASGGAAFIVGPEKESIGIIEGTCSFTTDTPDFWRRQGQEFPRHGARFTGEPAYYRHIIGACKRLMEMLDFSVADFDYFVFHQPNGKFPRVVAKKLGVPLEKVEPGIVVDLIGNTYSGSSLIGLAKVLDEAKPDDRILLCSFGSGAGSDAFSIRVTELIEEKRHRVVKVMDMVERKEYVDYGLYVKMRSKLKEW